MYRAILLALALSAVPAAVGAQGFPPARFTNLQVLPKDSGAADVVSMMKLFTQALGIRCQHCHVGEEGMALDKFDFAADTKPTKNTARAMMRLVTQINESLDQSLPAAAGQSRVTCWTCHGGRTTPPRQSP